METSEIRTETMDLLDHLDRYHSALTDKFSEEWHEKELRFATLRDEIQLKSPDWRKRISEQSLAEVEFDETRYISNFHRYLNYSVIVMLVVIVEAQLVKLCDDLASKRKLPINSKDLKGDTISQCRKYLEDLVGVPADSVDWKEVSEISKIRNCIVHALGRVELSRDRKFLRALPNSKREILIADDDAAEFGGVELGTLYLLDGYGKLSIQNARSFFDNLLKSLGY